ncbi:MAG: hypothetical protein ABSA31_05380 [Acidimicrobiales bacterium]|jgi:hypothetical protein
MRNELATFSPPAAGPAAGQVSGHNAGVRRRLTLVGLGIALAVTASFTTAFTTGSEAVTAVPFGLFVAAGVVAAVRRAAVPGRATPPRHGPGAAAWGTLGVMAFAFELTNYFLAPRAAHPTVSYFLTAIAGQPWSRGALFAAWLALGAWLLGR